MSNFFSFFLVFLFLAMSSEAKVKRPNLEGTHGRLPLQQLKIPDGLSIEVYAKVPGARSITLGDDGTVFVGSGGLTGKFKRVYAVQDRDRDGIGETVRILADGLNVPNGVAFRNGHLYVAEINRILVYENINKQMEEIPRGKKLKFKVLPFEFPSDGHHGWKFIRFAPDGRLFVPVGAPCNVCEKSDYALIHALDLKNQSKTTVARGVRNTVGFDFHPKTGKLWFTDNGRDMMGDDIPPDELNRLEKEGAHFGYPYCHGNGIKDPEFGHKKNCAETVSPVRELGPHVASLGMRFARSIGPFSKNPGDEVYIAEHGSWNRSSPIGYRVTRVRKESDGKYSYEGFIEGWLRPNGQRWGRPVDLEFLSDGSMLISDDRADVLYRLYKKN